MTPIALHQPLIGGLTATMTPIALHQPLIGGLTAGKWDRFATFGTKNQNGNVFTFSVETFGQIVDNFERGFRGRRLGMDYEHQALNAIENGQPAPNLAYYNALAVIKAGAVVQFSSQDAALPQPAPSVLLEALRQRYPDDPDADGLWGFRCEHTPLGAQLLPNYEQISPLFAAEGQDEQGNDVGYQLLNVSAVGVAFQDRTVLNLRTRTTSALSADKQGAKMADEENKDEKPAGATRAAACKALGLPEDASDDNFHGAVLAKYGAAPAADEDEDEEAKKKKEADAAAMAQNDSEMHAPGAMGLLRNELNAERQERVALQARLAKLEKEEQGRKAAAFSEWAQDFVSAESAAAFLKQNGGDAEKARAGIVALGLTPRRLGKQVQGSGDAGERDTVAAPGNVVGLGLAKQAREYAQKHNVNLMDAYRALEKKGA